MRILLTGASGQLGAYLITEAIQAGHDLVAWSGRTSAARGGVAIQPVDFGDAAALDRELERLDVDAVLHAGAISQAPAVFLNPAEGRAVNVEATQRIAAWSASRGVRLVFVSTDLVFDGTRGWYREADEPRPLLEYGRTKARAEEFVRELPLGLAARVALLYGPSRCGRPSPLDAVIDAVKKGERPVFFRDEFRTPLDYATAARILIALVENPATGVIHVAGAERMSRFEMMRRAVAAAGLDAGAIGANLQSDANLAEPRPADVSLDTSLLSATLPNLARRTVEQAISALFLAG